MTKDPIFKFSIRHIRLDSNDARIADELNFADRTSYLSWVAEWKTRWHELVAEIREDKRTMRDPASDVDQRGSAQSSREYRRREAFNLLLLRHEGKRKSAKLRAARLAAS